MKSNFFLSLIVLTVIIFCLSGCVQKDIINEVIDVNNNTEGRDIHIEINYRFYCPGSTEKIEFTTLVPKDYSKRQKIDHIEFNMEPNETISEDGNQYCFFILEDLDEYFEITINSFLTVYDFDLKTARQVSTKLSEVDENYEEYLQPEKYIESADEDIKDIAYVLKEKEDIETVKNYYDFILKSLDYGGYNPFSLGAEKALESGSGDCTEYSDLLTALCRASGIPARVIEGYTCEKGDRSIGHNWAEVYFQDIGWVPLDPTYDDEGSDISFDDLDANYLYLSFIRNDDMLLNYHYYSYHYWGEEPEIIKEVYVK